MNSPLPASLSRTDPDDDIDARILHVEQRLIAREENLRRNATALGVQLKRRFSPRQLLVPVGGGLLAVAALVALWRRPAAVARGAQTQSPPRAGIPWVRLLGLAWPLLPARWRAHVSPAAASSLVTLGLPFVEVLLNTGRSHAPLETVAEVDLARLSGRWFLVGELPPAHGGPAEQPPELGLLPREDGRLDLLQRRIDASGTHGSEALVEAVAGSQGGRLRISHWPEALRWLPMAWTEHGVLHVDADYEEALIGSVGRDSLWLLSRCPTLAPERRQALAQIAQDRGFAADRLHPIG